MKTLHGRLDLALLCSVQLLMSAPVCLVMSRTEVPDGPMTKPAASRVTRRTTFLPVAEGWSGCSPDQIRHSALAAAHPLLW
jgi:hypothetical protein